MTYLLIHLYYLPFKINFDVPYSNYVCHTYYLCFKPSNVTVIIREPDNNKDYIRCMIAADDICV